MRRVALLLEYDGAAYAGSQRQRNAPTVQEALEETLRRLTGAVPRTGFAGRTDAGVHATGQVAAFSTESRLVDAELLRGLNALLPEDIAVRAVRTVSEGFDPRRDARSRRYRYRIWNAPARRPLLRRTAWHVRMPLDVAAMERAAALLVGEQDVASFGGDPGPGRGTRRVVFRSCLSADGALVRYEVEATAFLPHQVRRTVAALVEIGAGRLPERAFADWLARPRTGAVTITAPPHGLCLVRVEYGEQPGGPGDWNTPAKDSDDEDL